MENFGELKSICIENVMKIMKLGDKTWQNAVISQIRPSFFTANVFHCTVCINLLYLHGQIKGHNSSMTAIICEVGSYRTVVE